MLTVLCCSLEPYICHSITLLEIKHWQPTGLDMPQEKEEDVSYSTDYEDIADHLPNIQEIKLDVYSAREILPWLTLPSSCGFFPKVHALKFSFLGFEDPNDTAQNDTAMLARFMDSRAESGHPIHVVLIDPCVISGATLARLREKDRTVSLVTSTVQDQA
jgi:hypothetical protein